jgi:hypothetical protein
MLMSKTKKTTFAIVALMLCMGAFLSAFQPPATAYADTVPDTAKPTIKAWIDKDSLHVEAVDGQSGVGEVYINDIQAVTQVSGPVGLPARDYAGNGEFISLYAVDYAGNKSNLIKIRNPYYSDVFKPAESAEPPAIPEAPETETTDTTKSGAEADTSPSPAPTAQAEIVSQSKPFTPDGAGTVMDNAADSNGKEFYTIKSAGVNVFFLVIDRQRNSENVYFLNAVTEDDLAALAEKSGSHPCSRAAYTADTHSKPGSHAAGKERKH